MEVRNPILPGFYPDPSICRVGEYFYLVNSSFAYFPGVPIFRSKDLRNWKQIGNVLDRPSQLPLRDASMSSGIFAPTIRYHDGVFYITTTNVCDTGNFIVTAEDPEGPWSEPYPIKGAEGIDPSLFFDEDGTCYYIGSRPNPTGVKYNGDWYLYIQKLDTKKMEFIGDYKIVWNGAMKNAVWPEGPHLYKKDGYYYIVHAEGGTGPEHAVCVARSKNVFGPYEGNLKNPIMTHRHLGSEYPVRYVGHADFVATENGDWYAVMLASRPYERHSNLGRETFLAEVIWEEGWPVINPGIGMLNVVQQVKLKPDTAMYGMVNQSYSGIFTFKEEKLDPHFIMLRNPKEGMYSLTQRKRYLRLSLQEETLYDKASPAYIGFRQQHYFYEAKVKMEFTPVQDGECAGIAILQSEEANLIYVYEMQDGERKLSLYQKKKGCKPRCIEQSRLVMEGEYLILKMAQKGQKLECSYSFDEVNYTVTAMEVNASFLSTEEAGGFVGNTIGMYASSNGKHSENYADYSYFSYIYLK